MSGQREIRKPIAALLQRLLEVEDMRPEDLAAELHVSHRTVTRWLAGRTEPTPTLARALGARFQMDWRDFYGASSKEAA